MLIEDVGRAGLDGRLPAVLLAGRRAAGRRAAVDRRRDEVELVGVSGFAALAAVVRALVVVRVAPGVVVVVVLRLVVVLVAAALRAGAATAAFAVDIFLAASLRALAAVIMALVAVFIDCMADDIVFADAVALVAAVVILVAADVTLVAADDTFLAAVAGVAAPPAARRAVVRAAVARPVVVRRAAVARDAVDRGAVLRVDREAVPRAVGVVDRADLVVVLRDLGDALDDLERELGCDRLAVPLDALRLTDLLRAVLAGLRRAAARVVD